MATAYIQHHVIQIPAMRSDYSWRTKSSTTLPAAGDTPTRTTPTGPHGAEHLARLEAAVVIQRWWVGARNKRVFCLLKKAICAAEHSLTQEILRKVCPVEAELLKDPAMQARVKFRFGGSRFPPAILFKIFTSSTGGGKVQYISGKKMIKPASEAAEDARRQMGNRVFYDQMLQDACRHQHLGVTEEVDVTTVKEYMQYMANMDESPASAGGRDNTWRKLNLEVLPRHSFLYNIVDFLGKAWQPGGMSLQRLQSFTRPPTQYEQIEHIKAVSSLSPHRLSPRRPPPSHDSRPPSWGRRSRQAQQRAARMKKAYTEGDEGGDERPSSEASVPDMDTADVRDSSPQAGTMGGVTDREGRGRESAVEAEEEDEWERAASDLYQWTQELSFEDIR